MLVWSQFRYAKADIPVNYYNFFVEALAYLAEIVGYWAWLSIDAVFQAAAEAAATLYLVAHKAANTSVDDSST